MRQPNTPILILTVLAIAFVLIASLAAISTDDGGTPEMVTSLRGERIELYGGHGLYQYDSVTKAVLFRGYDWANLIVCLPLAVFGLYRRGQLKGQLLLAAIFGYLAYNYLIGVMGNAFNNLFLVWTALFALGIWGMVVVLTRLDIRTLPTKLKAGFPVKIVAVYLIILAIFLLVSYGSEIITALTTGSPPPSLQVYTTLELAVLELAVMIPLHIVSGGLLWQKSGWGYFLAILLVFMACMTFISLTAGQALMYFSLHRGTVPDMLIMVVLAVISTGLALSMFRQVKDEEMPAAWFHA
jgi:hypothetical protein